MIISSFWTTDIILETVDENPITTMGFEPIISSQLIPH